MADLTDAGLSVQALADILAAIEADQKANVSANLDLSTSSPNGQINRLMARAVSLEEEALAALFAAIDPDSATGDALFRLGALRGTIRNPAQPTRVTVTVNLNAGTYAPGTLTVYPLGRPSELYRNAASVTLGSTGNVAVVFQAVTPGPAQVAANTMQRVPSSGFNSVVSNLDGVPGQALETEGQFRARSNAELERPGSSSVGGIVADLTGNIPSIISCFATENDTDATVDSVPPHSVEVVVYGPDPAVDADNDAVASQILASKAGGIGTYGGITRTVYDPQGWPHAISFTRPAAVPITVGITVAVDATKFGSAADVVAAIVAAGSVRVPGRDAAWSVVASWALGVLGVYRVTAISLNGSPFTDVAITSRQFATFASADVTVTVVPSNP